MRNLTKKEEIIMDHFWREGPMFIRDLRMLYPEPRPHFNTLSGQVRTLEADGFVSHVSYGPVFRYAPAVTREEYNSAVLSGVVDKFFGKSYLKVVSALVQDEKISLEELEALVADLKQ